MKKDIKQQLTNWGKTNNGHPYDDQRLYEIVLATMDYKIGSEEFFKIVKKKPITSYRRYEDLLEFARYLKKKK